MVDVLAGVEVRILGQFRPSEFCEATIQAEIRAHLPACCQRERISVRVPNDRAAAPHPDNLEWHQDGGGPLGTTHHMVVWASEMPTEIRSSDGVIAVTSAEDLVWYDNTKAFHRQPRGTDETKRWFVAIRCSGD
jgi:hypothetical protein